MSLFQTSVIKDSLSQQDNNVITEFKNQTKGARINMIRKLVYGLGGLTDEEIAIVEGGSDE